MKLINQQDNPAILSNVGEVGEFRVRNSAKAFNILSSGLYANKIRAIIRELSCNAVDSHTAAGCADKPFDIHLPTQLEPWFSIRDYGVGLNHQQVTDIYTTYFESTKTASNEFIGALGLGSKSPFSYTDNFTVTAVKDGRRGIYTAFINEQGVPSIALMMEEQSDEPNGVEVKFAVEKTQDFRQFGIEASQVYAWFKTKPIISGQTIRIQEIEVVDRDVIPGVHFVKTCGNVAVMGNIAYPIQVPDTKALGDVANLLQRGGLLMEFSIGELDFQASREGLSYIPETVAAIKAKLEALDKVISDKLFAELDAIPNKWERQYRLMERADQHFWSSAVTAYLASPGKVEFKSAFDPYSTRSQNYRNSHRGHQSLSIDFEDLAKRFNIRISSAFVASCGSCSNMNPGKGVRDVKINGVEKRIQYEFWQFEVQARTTFVVNDTKTVSTNRVKDAYRKSNEYKTVFVLTKVDPKREMDLKAFFDALDNPPENQRILLSSLPETSNPKSDSPKILCLRSTGYWRSSDFEWQEAGTLDIFEDTKTYYYLPVTGYALISKYGMEGVKELLGLVRNSGLGHILKINTDLVYAVRKANLEEVKAKPNWINFEDHLAQKISNIDQSTRDALASTVVDSFAALKQMVRTSKGLLPKLTTGTPMEKFVKRFAGKTRPDEIRINLLTDLTKKYGNGFDLAKDMDLVRAECENLIKLYPMLSLTDLSGIDYHPDRLTIVADYVNMVRE